MQMKNTKKAPSFENLVPDAELREKMKEHLYSGQALFGEGSIFSDLLQAAVNGMLNGEMNDFLEEERAKDKANSRPPAPKKSSKPRPRCKEPTKKPARQERQAQPDVRSAAVGIPDRAGNTGAWRCRAE